MNRELTGGVSGQEVACLTRLLPNKRYHDGRTRKESQRVAMRTRQCLACRSATSIRWR